MKICWASAERKKWCRKAKSQWPESHIEVRFARGSEADEVFLHARRGSDDIVVPAHLRDQMLRELMTVETLIDTVDMLLADRRGSAAEKLIVVSDERSSWGSTPQYLAA